MLRRQINPYSGVLQMRGVSDCFMLTTLTAETWDQDSVHSAKERESHNGYDDKLFIVRTCQPQLKSMESSCRA